MMTADVKTEAARLFKEGKSSIQVRLELEAKGFSVDDVGKALDDFALSFRDAHSKEERHNSRYLSIREVFDRIGYGAATPQIVNILFWLSQRTNPFVFAIIGVLNGLKTLLSIVWSGIIQEYSKVHRISKNAIAQAGVVFGFSFLFLSFGILLSGTMGIILFSASLLVGSIAAVAYGDLYQRFVRDTIRKERMSGFLRTIAVWGVLITASTLIVAGYLIDAFPMSGTLWTFELFGASFSPKIYGYLLAFEVTAFSFIIAGYVSSLVIDKREERTYPFGKFLREYFHMLRQKMAVVWSNKYVSLLLLATIVSGFLQIIIASYSGIVIYQFFAEHYPAFPFTLLAIIYAVAIIASFTGPFFTQQIHRSTGLTPTLVFGTLLTAILPLILVYNQNIVTITAALCLHVIGASIVGFSQGLLAQKLMDDELRKDYFQVQSFMLIIPYLLLIPILAAASLLMPLESLFLIVAAGLIIIVVPIYFLLVTISQKLKL